MYTAFTISRPLSLCGPLLAQDTDIHVCLAARQTLRPTNLARKDSFRLADSFCGVASYADVYVVYVVRLHTYATHLSRCKTATGHKSVSDREGGLLRVNCAIEAYCWQPCNSMHWAIPVLWLQHWCVCVCVRAHVCASVRGTLVRMSLCPQRPYNYIVEPRGALGKYPPEKAFEDSRGSACTKCFLILGEELQTLLHTVPPPRQSCAPSGKKNSLHGYAIASVVGHAKDTEYL